MLKSYGIRQSFSRVGVPGDNAWAESFFATFKKERIHLNLTNNGFRQRKGQLNYAFSLFLLSAKA